MQLILASTSPYRRQLLQRLQLPFTCEPPGTDETPLANETPAALAQRLACAKAQSVSETHPDALVIGSDQVAALENQLLHKPGDHRRATRQLQACSGQNVVFHTGLCLMRAQDSLCLSCVIPFEVQFRVLSDLQIQRYLERDQPYDCAGSFKVESLGITLFERMAGEDPTALEGLPLIALTSLLQRAGVSPY